MFYLKEQETLVHKNTAKFQISKVFVCLFNVYIISNHFLHSFYYFAASNAINCK